MRSNRPTRLARSRAVTTVLIVLSAACAAPDDDASSAAQDDAAGPAASAGITPQPIPAGYDFPANRAALQATVDSNDVAAMRTHAWNVWAGMTASSNSTYEGATIPIWETWLATAQVFTDPPTERPAPLDAPPRMFVPAAQATHLGRSLAEDEQIVVGFNKYDPAMVQYLLEAHTSPVAPGSFRYTSKPSLAALNDSWPDTTAIIDREVAQAPNRAMELKPVLMWVDSVTVTAIPFWQGPQASTDPACAGVTPADARNTADTTGVIDCHPTPDTWTHCVLVDPAAPSAPLGAATQDQFDAADRTEAPGCEFANARYGGLDLLYHFPLDSAAAADFAVAQNDSTVQAGDHAVLMAMHVNTKEIVDWTWQTFWWQAGESPPDDFPGGTGNMTPNVTGVWRNYAMCTAYSQTVQPDDRGAMRVCFNPFLETSGGIPDGIQSNCVTCHGTARFPTTPGPIYPPDYTRPVEFGSPVYFQGRTRTDFSWAMPLNATGG